MEIEWVDWLAVLTEVQWDEYEDEQMDGLMALMLAVHLVDLKSCEEGVTVGNRGI